jgi:hypothetical protein
MDIHNTHRSDRTRNNQLQRERRKRFTRIDYIDVSPEASKVINSLRDGNFKGTVSEILNQIVVEWAEQNGSTKEDFLSSKNG